MKKMKMTVALLVFLPFLAAAQRGDPAIQQARAELEPVFALGRLFDYLATMEGQQPRLALSRAQAAKIVDDMGRIKVVRRFDAKTATDMLSQIEDHILTPEQLKFADGLELASKKTQGQNKSLYSSSLIDSLASYVAGGPFNPMTDTHTPQGKYFAALSQLLSKKLARQ